MTAAGRRTRPGGGPTLGMHPGPGSALAVAAAVVGAHAMDHHGGGWLDRSVRAQPFGWRDDGLPDFGRPVATGLALPQPSGTQDAPAP